ncbi:Actin-related protein 2/3 complex subunit 4, partial [Teratosphaeria destructans]
SPTNTQPSCPDASLPATEQAIAHRCASPEEPPQHHPNAHTTSPHPRTMSQSLRPYLSAVRSTLTAALSLSNFASQASERHNVPEIEAQTSPELLLNPLIVSRNAEERVLIEASVNSVRVSLRIKQADEIEHILVHKFTRFLTQRAEAFFVLRRKAVEGYDISFLVTNFHTEAMLKHKLVDFVIQFMEEVDREISEMKLFLNARARFVAESFLVPNLECSVFFQALLVFAPRRSPAHTLIIFARLQLQRPASHRTASKLKHDYCETAAHMAGRTLLRSETIRHGRSEYSGGFTPLRRVEEIGEGDITPRTSNFPYQIPFRSESGHALRINTTRGQAGTPTIDTPTDDGNEPGGVSLEGMTSAFEEPRKQETDGDVSVIMPNEMSSSDGRGTNYGLGTGIGSIDAIVMSPVSEPRSIPPPHAYRPVDNYHEKDRFSGGQTGRHTPRAGGAIDQRSFSRQSNRNKHSAHADQKRSGTPKGYRGQQRIFSRSQYGETRNSHGASSGRSTPGKINGQNGNGMHASHAPGGLGRQAHGPLHLSAPYGMVDLGGFNGADVHVIGPAGFETLSSPFPGPRGFNAAANGTFGGHGVPGSHSGFIASPGGYDIERPQSAVHWANGAMGMPQQQPDHGISTGPALRLPNYPQQGSSLRTNSYAGSESSGRDSVHDSKRAVHGSRARELAVMIKSGACDPGDDYDYGKKNIYGPMTYYGNKKAGELSPTKYRADERHNCRFAARRDKDSKGSAAAYIGVEPRTNPYWLHRTQLGFRPSSEQFFDALPITEPCRHIAPSNAGVIRLMGFPFEAPRAEVTAFLCRQAKIVPQPLGSPYFAVHVIMERSTGKTNDAFIELTSEVEAVRVVSQSEKRMLNGRPQKMGDRTVEVVMSCQEDLMHEMFGKAKKIVWAGNMPVVSNEVECYYPGVPSEGFNGFIGTEELHEMLQRCEHPQRYFHITRHQPRLFEHWISTLVKYPWHALDCVFIAERDRMFEATMKIVAALVNALQYASKGSYDVNKVTIGTLRELTVTVLTCPGFSEVQKAAYVRFMFENELAGVCDPKGTNLAFGGVRAISACWPFKVLAIDPAAPKEMVEYFMYLIREALQAQEKQLSLAERHRRRMSGSVSGPFGNLAIDYKDAQTIGEVGELELDFVEELLHRVLE